MWQCHYCRTSLSLELRLKNRLCPACGSDIHCCLNCQHYNESLSSKCDEPNSPWIADRSKQNDCSFFECSSRSRTGTSPAESHLVEETNAEAERAKAAFKALFRTP